MKRIEDFTVISHKWLNYKTFIIELEAPEALPEILPGNFAEVQISNSPKVFLRRPLSVYDADPDSHTLSFFVKVAGEGTRLMGVAKQGDIMNIIYPLGNSFSVAEGNKMLIVAGGSGIAPFMLLARRLRKLHKNITFLFGGRTAEDIVLTDKFHCFGELLITTEDGSLGEKGLVTDHTLFKNNKLEFDHIYTCGPDLMMKAIASIAKEKNIPCEISLENSMACGFGACLCCITETIEGNKCVCTEGPVFDINYLKWQT